MKLSNHAEAVKSLKEDLSTILTEMSESILQLQPTEESMFDVEQVAFLQVIMLLSSVDNTLEDLCDSLG